MSTSQSQEQATKTGGSAIDLVDLLYHLAALKQPDRFVDKLVELIIHRRRFNEVLTASKVRFSNWLDAEVPEFTAGGPALNVLAAKLGYRIEVISSKGRFKATATDLRKRTRVNAYGYLAGSAGILALVRLAMQEKRAS